METTRAPAPHAHPPLGLWDTVSVIIGIVVGVGIYKTPPGVFGNVPGPWAGLAVWAVAGVLCLAGALCYAELATTYPRSGGDYVYLTRAYGPLVGFLFGWAQLAVILTGNIGMMAYVFADYAATLWNFGPGSTVAYAALAVVTLTTVNVLGVVFGRRIQNVLTAAKVLGLAGVVVAGLCGSAASTSAAPTASGIDFTPLGFAFISVFLTYGGWNDAAFVAAEVRHGRRNIPLALVLGTLGIIVIYLLVNAAYLRGLGFEGVRHSKAVASDVLARSVGSWGGRAIAVLIMISALGAVNGLIFTGSRIYATLGTDYGAFAWLARWHPRRHSPTASLITQAAITLGMIALVGTSAGQGAVNDVLRALHLQPGSWDRDKGFETLLRCTAPVFWFFFLLTGLSLFVLRFKDWKAERPFKVPLYPVVPLVFCLTCAYMLYSGILYAWTLGLVGGGLLALGVPLFFLSSKRPAAEPVVSPRPAADYV